MPSPTPQDDEARRREAVETLDRLREPTPLAGSALAAAGRRAAAHFAGRDPADAAQPPDAAELWGRRIGRALSLAGCVGLALYLYLTYLR